MIMSAILIFSFLVLPEARKLTDLNKSLKTDAAMLDDYKSRLQRLKTLPEFFVYLDLRDNMMLALKKTIETRGYRVTDIKPSKDGIGNFLSFSIEIVNYNSIGKVIDFLEDLKKHLPVAYTGYTLTNKLVKVNVKCYVL